MPKPEIPQSKIITPQVYTPQDEEVDIRELIGIIWKGKWFILCVSAIVAMWAVFYAISIPDEYKATVLLAPASKSSSSSLSKLAGQYGGLASLAGLSLGGGSGDDKTTISIELMNTWGFLEKFIISNQLEIEVFATVGWDKSKNKLLIDETLYDEKNAKWLRVDKAGEISGEKPTSWELYKKIQGKIYINKNTETGLISLSIEHYSPFIAKKWVDLLVIAINEHMQEQDRVEALNSIEYLKEQISKTNIAEMRSIFYQLIEEQTKTLMLAEINNEYVLKTISSSKVPEEKSKPKRALLVIFWVAFAGGISVLIVLLRYFLTKK